MTHVKEYIDKLVSEGYSIKQIGAIGSEYEITRQAFHNKDSILLFSLREHDEIMCYTNIISTRKLLYKALHVQSDSEAYEKLLYALNNPLSLETVSFNEYFKETNYTLEDLPFIKYYREDGGYYLTSSIIVSCYGEICNASFHRMMRINEHEATIRIVPRHLHYLVRKYHSEGKPAPVAIVLGLHPVAEIAAASSPPLSVYEFTVAARLLGDNKAVKTPIHGIPVPAYASIILEGIIDQTEAPEGPFVDILRLTDKQRKQPVFKLEAVYVNKNYPPYYHAIVPGLEEHIYLMGFPRESLIYDSLRKIAPEIKGVRLTPGSGGWLHAVISIKKTRRGEAKNIGLAVLVGHPSVKHVVVVDDDIDIDDPYSIEWAIATRVKGSEDIIILRNLRGSTLDPRSNEGIGDKIIIDATKPFDQPWEYYRRAEIP